MTESPSMFLIEIQGELVKTFHSEHIEKIFITSEFYENDLITTDHLINSMKDVLDGHLEAEYNPDFYPTIDKIELSDFEEAMIEDSYSQLKPGEIAIFNKFDPLGDNVKARYTIKTDDSVLIGKVMLRPDDYFKETLQKVH